MITGRWGKPSEVLLDLVVEEDGSVRGVANPGRQNAPIRRGHFDAISGAVNLEGEHVTPDGTTAAVSHRRGVSMGGRFDSRTSSATCAARPMWCAWRNTRHRRSPSGIDLKPRIAGLKRWINARSRPTGEENARKLRERGESLDSITFRDAVAADIPALAELHVTTWNATYNTTRGPTIATRTWQWNQVFAKEQPARLRARPRGPERTTDRIHLGPAPRGRVRG